MIDNCTDQWGNATAIKPKMAKYTKDLGILMVQSRGDGVTPYLGAASLNNALTNARMIVVGDGEYSHGIFPYATMCVDEQVIDYFLGGKMPDEKFAQCPNKHNAQLRYERDDYLTMYKNPKDAQQLIDDIHQSVIKAN